MLARDLRKRPGAGVNVDHVRRIQTSVCVMARTRRPYKVKSFLLVVGGVCAAAAGFIVWGSKQRQPVEQLAHRLEEAWADHHTVV